MTPPPPPLHHPPPPKKCIYEMNSETGVKLAQLSNNSASPS